jgi:hypothetical protein
MMARGPTIQPVASPSVSVQGVSNNAALELARGLATNAPKIEQAIGVYSQKEAERLRVQAEQDVIATGGAQFADAVRDGRLRKTQNPWYIDAYEKNRASLVTRKALTDLSLEAAQWDERDDPVAFQTRWQEEAGKIGEQFGTKASQEGFQAPYAEITSQVVNSNTAHNAARIEKEQNNAAVSQVTLAIADAATKPGGIAGNRKQIMDSLASQKEAFFSTGGSASEWDALVSEGVTAAGFSLVDPSALDLLDMEAAQGGPLNALPQVAKEASANRFYIQQAKDAAASNAIKAARDARILKATEVANIVGQQYTDDIIAGTFDYNAAVENLRGQGYDIVDITEGLNVVREANAAVSGVATYNYDPTGARPQRNLQLFTRAAEQGATPSVRSQIQAALVSGDLEEDEAISYMRTALATTNRNEGKAEDAGMSGVKGFIGNASNVRTSVKGLASAVPVTLKDLNINLSQREQDDLEGRMLAAANIRLSQGGPTALVEAYMAAEDVAKEELLARTEQADREQAMADRIAEALTKKTAAATTTAAPKEAPQ